MKNNGFALVSVIIAFVIISLMALFFTNIISLKNWTVADKIQSLDAHYKTLGVLEYILANQKFRTYSTKVSQCNVNARYFNLSGSTYNLIVDAKCGDIYKKFNVKLKQFYKIGTFTKRNGTGLQTVGGIGFRPKAIIFFWTAQTTTGFNANVNAGIGMTDGTSQNAVSVTMRDNRGRSDQGRRFSSTDCIIFLSGGGPPTLVARAQLSSFNNDGFIVNWVTNTNAQPYIINYVAFGGDEIEAKVNSFNLTNAPGIQNVTGIGFKPDTVFFLWTRTQGGNQNTNLARSQLGFGFAKSNTEQGAIVQAGSDNVRNNNDKRWQQRTDSCILLLTDVNPPTQDAVVSLVSMNIDGFSINKLDPPAANNTIYYLAIKGGKHKIGSFLEPASNSVLTINDTLYPLSLAFFGSYNLTANPALQFNGGVSFGVASLVEQKSIWYQDRNVDPSDANMYNSDTSSISLAFSQTLRGQATLIDVSRNSFNLNWTNCDGTQRQILYWLINLKPKILEIAEVID